MYLVSSGAGSLGIDLTGATRMIIFDVSWNPAQDNQSVFRIHRIGQKETTFIYRFVTAGTMEEKMYKRQILKESLSKRIVDNYAMDQLFEKHETIDLFKYVEPTRISPVALPKDDSLLSEIIEECPHLILHHFKHDLFTKNNGQNTSEAETHRPADIFPNEIESGMKPAGSKKRLQIESCNRFQITKSSDRILNVLKTNMVDILKPRPTRG